MRKILIGSIIMSMSFSALGNDCSEVLKLSAVSEKTVLNESDFNEKASQFCKDYAKNKGNRSSSGLGGGYGDYSLDYSNSSRSSSYVAEKTCKADDESKVSQFAYSNYIANIAPQAFDSYNQCLNVNNNLSIKVDHASESEAIFGVAFNSDSAGDSAKVSYSITSGVECKWTETAKKSLKLENGESGTLTCSRSESSKKDSIKIDNKRSANASSSLSFPWAAYKNNVPMDLNREYLEAVKLVNDLKKDLKGSVVAFNLNNCPSGWKEYENAYGRFIRGIDKATGTKIDPDGQRKPGHTQGFLIQSHHHEIKNSGNAEWQSKKDKDAQRVGQGTGYKTTAVGGKETRPVNVALLYCEKE